MQLPETHPLPSRRKSQGADFYRALLDKQSQSGVSVKRTAEKHGIPYATLMYWRNRFRRDESRDAQAQKLVPVKITAPTEPPNPFEIQTTSGHTLRVPTNFCVDTLQRLLQVLSTPC
jgi:transposase-like protein